MIDFKLFGLLIMDRQTLVIEESLSQLKTSTYRVSQQTISLSLIFEYLSSGGVFLRVKNNSKNFEPKILSKGCLQKKNCSEGDIGPFSFSPLPP